MNKPDAFVYEQARGLCVKLGVACGASCFFSNTSLGERV